MFHTLRHRDFALLWVGQFVSVLGDHLLLLALPFYVLERTGSVLAAGGTLAAGAVPRALVGPLGGVVADRFPHRRVMITCDLVNVGLVLSLLAVGAGAPVWIVYAVVFGHATVGQIFRPTKTALIPQLVGRDELLTANSLNSSSEALTQLVGPVTGGAIFGIFGLTAVVVLDAATFVVSAVLIALMRTRSRSDDATTTGIVRPLREGFRAIRTHPVAKALLVVAALIGIASGMLQVLVVPYVRNVLGRGPETLGVLASVQGVGTIIGALGTGTVGRRFTPAKLIAAAGFGAGLSVFVVANTHVLVIAALALLAAGVPNAAGMIAAQTLLQTTTESRYLGRLAGAFGMAIGVTTILGLGLAGALADTLGTVAVMHVSGVIYLAGGVTAALLLRTRPEPPPEPPRVHLLSRCSDAELQTLMRCGEIVSRLPGKTLQRDTDPCNWVYFILEGTVMVRRDGCIRSICGPGSVIGLREAFEHTGPATEITTLCDATVFVVERRRLERVLTGHPRFALGLIRELAGAGTRG